MRGRQRVLLLLALGSASQHPLSEGAQAVSLAARARPAGAAAGLGAGALDLERGQRRPLHAGPAAHGRVGQHNAFRVGGGRDGRVLVRRGGGGDRDGLVGANRVHLRQRPPRTWAGGAASVVALDLVEHDAREAALAAAEDADRVDGVHPGLRVVWVLGAEGEDTAAVAVGGVVHELDAEFGAAAQLAAGLVHAVGGGRLGQEDAAYLVESDLAPLLRRLGGPVREALGHVVQHAVAPLPRREHAHAQALLLALVQEPLAQHRQQLALQRRRALPAARRARRRQRHRRPAQQQQQQQHAVRPQRVCGDTLCAAPNPS
mmetsp:Transcript_2013/g.6203  ORF Transcript_2013/g.6203 Transcript_2013/m.6203 type:complete len:317 (-) Transcript_2013:78-1028(-)